MLASNTEPATKNSSMINFFLISLTFQDCSQHYQTDHKLGGKGHRICMINLNQDQILHLPVSKSTLAASFQSITSTLSLGKEGSREGEVLVGVRQKGASLV